MDLKELEELKDFNELDLLYKLIEKSEKLKKRTEQVLRGNKSAGVDVRKAMQDIRLLSEIIRDLIQSRRNKKNTKDSKLNKAIKAEKKRLLFEEERIKKLEEKRTVQR